MFSPIILSFSHITEAQAGYTFLSLLAKRSRFLNLFSSVPHKPTRIEIFSAKAEETELEDRLIVPDPINSIKTMLSSMYPS